MTNFAELKENVVYPSPVLVLTGEHIEAMTGLGGYTHPIFTDPELRARRFDAPIISGGMLVFLAGGLAERSGLFEEPTLVLTGFESVSFRCPAMLGDSIRVDISVLERGRKGDRCFIAMQWSIMRDDGVELAVAKPTFLFSPP